MSRQLSATCAGELRAVPRPRQAWLETCFPLGKIKMTQRTEKATERGGDGPVGRGGRAPLGRGHAVTL